MSVKKVMISSISALAMYALLCAVFGDPLVFQEATTEYEYVVRC